MIEKVVLGFGSNFGNRVNYIESALRYISLSDAFDFLALSSIYETEPWGYKKQKNFLNCVGIFLCRFSPAEALKTINRIEKKIGRVDRGKWKAREIDIDVLFYGRKIIKTKKYSIPHPLVAERNFVLKPMAELMPDFVHPMLKKSMANLYRISKDKGKVSLHNNYDERHIKY